MLIEKIMMGDLRGLVGSRAVSGERQSKVVSETFFGNKAYLNFKFKLLSLDGNGTNNFFIWLALKTIFQHFNEQHKYSLHECIAHLRKLTGIEFKFTNDFSLSSKEEQKSCYRKPVSNNYDRTDPRQRIVSTMKLLKEAKSDFRGQKGGTHYC